MFGVTTPAVDVSKAELEKSGYEVLVFHATGNGGRIMENLIIQKQIHGVLDLTTSELADELVEGIMSAGPSRLTAASKASIPQVVLPGAMDIVNFGKRPTVPAKYESRLLYEHNPDITLLRTSPEEYRLLGNQMADKLKTFAKRSDLIRVILPKGGISMISTPGGPYRDPEADSAPFNALLTGLDDTGIAVIEDERDINDKELALEMANSLIDLMTRANHS